MTSSSLENTDILSHVIVTIISRRSASLWFPLKRAFRLTRVHQSDLGIISDSQGAAWLVQSLTFFTFSEDNYYKRGQISRISSLKLHLHFV
jgi:hypothetical protein